MHPIHHNKINCHQSLPLKLLPHCVHTPGSHCQASAICMYYCPQFVSQGKDPREPFYSRPSPGKATRPNALHDPHNVLLKICPSKVRTCSHLGAPARLEISARVAGGTCEPALRIPTRSAWKKKPSTKATKHAYWGLARMMRPPPFRPRSLPSLRSPPSQVLLTHNIHNIVRKLLFIPRRSSGVDWRTRQVAAAMASIHP